MRRRRHGRSEGLATGVLRRSRALALVIGCAVAASGCLSGRQLDREELTAKYIAELVAAGVSEDAARCIITGLFEDMSAAELRDFNLENDALDPETSAQLDALVRTCGA